MLSETTREEKAPDCDGPGTPGRKAKQGLTRKILKAPALKDAEEEKKRGGPGVSERIEKKAPAPRQGFGGRKVVGGGDAAPHSRGAGSGKPAMEEAFSSSATRKKGRYVLLELKRRQGTGHPFSSQPGQAIHERIGGHQRTGPAAAHGHCPRKNRRRTYQESAKAAFRRLGRPISRIPRTGTWPEDGDSSSITTAHALQGTRAPHRAEEGEPGRAGTTCARFAGPDEYLPSVNLRKGISRPCTVVRPSPKGTVVYRRQNGNHDSVKTGRAQSPYPSGSRDWKTEAHLLGANNPWRLFVEQHETPQFYQLATIGTQTPLKAGLEGSK